jgi:hypothetical protein
MKAARAPSSPLVRRNRLLQCLHANRLEMRRIVHDSRLPPGFQLADVRVDRASLVVQMPMNRQSLPLLPATYGFSLRLNQEAISFQESSRLPGCSPTAFVAFGFRGGPSLLAITQPVKQDCRVAEYKRPYQFGEVKRLVDFARFRNPKFPRQEESRCFAFSNQQSECLLFVPQFS